MGPKRRDPGAAGRVARIASGSTPVYRDRPQIAIDHEGETRRPRTEDCDQIRHSSRIPRNWNFRDLHSSNGFQIIWQLGACEYGAVAGRNRAARRERIQRNAVSDD